MVVFFFAIRRKILQRHKTIKYSKYNQISSHKIRHCLSMSNIAILPWNMKHCQTRGSSNSFHTFSLYHIVSCTGKCYLTVTSESVLILTILHHIVFACDILCNITESFSGKANFYVSSESIKQTELNKFSRYSNFVHQTITV